MPPKSATSSRPVSGPPRSAWAGGKKAAPSVPSTAAAAADELKQKSEVLERSLRNEELARNAAQLERNRIQSFWGITKRELGDARAELLVKEKELEEEEDRHGLELKVYKQRVKHLLYEHSGHVARLKVDGEAALKAQGEAFAAQEAQLTDDKRRLRQHVREQELSGEELLKQFRLDNAKQASKMRADFESQARRIQAKYEAQLRELHAAAEQAYAADLADQEQRSAAHVAALTAAHEAAMGGQRAYYSKVTLANLDLIRTLKEEIAGMRAAEAQRERLVGDVVRENRALTEPLGKAKQEAEALRAQVSGAERDRAALAAAKARLAAAERAGRAREWELEVTRQRLEKVQQELAELQQRHQALALHTLQRGALRGELLALQMASKAALVELRQGGASSVKEAKNEVRGGEPLQAAARATTPGSEAGASVGSARASQQQEEGQEQQEEDVQEQRQESMEEEEQEQQQEGKHEEGQAKVQDESRQEQQEEGRQQASQQEEGEQQNYRPVQGGQHEHQEEVGGQQDSQREDGKQDQQEEAGGQQKHQQEGEQQPAKRTGWGSAVLPAALHTPLPDEGADSLEEG